jgi:hypothetical protein
MNISTNASINTYADSDYYNHYNIKNSDDPNKADSTNRPGSPEECQTCKNRKYVDGSNENVSYKSAAHIAPGAAGNAVRAHEGEHVSNAYTKASQNNGKVISASVSIHTSVCPECGRTYVSGGTTNTMIIRMNPIPISRSGNLRTLCVSPEIILIMLPESKKPAKVFHFCRLIFSINPFLFS